MSAEVAHACARDQPGPVPVQLSGGLSSQAHAEDSHFSHSLTVRGSHIAQQFSDTSVPQATFSIAYTVANFQVVI